MGMMVVDCSKRKAARAACLMPGEARAHADTMTTMSAELVLSTDQQPD